MAPVWLTREAVASTRPRILALYRQMLREIRKGPDSIGLAARETSKKDLRVVFDLGSEQDSVANIEELVAAGEHALKQLRRGHLPDVAPPEGSLV